MCAACWEQIAQCWTDWKDWRNDKARSHNFDGVQSPMLQLSVYSKTLGSDNLAQEEHSCACARLILLFINILTA